MDAAACKNLQRRIALSKAPRAMRIMRSPHKVLYSAVVNGMCTALGFTVHRSARTFWGDSMRVVFPNQISNFIFRYGFFEADISSFLCSHLRPGMTVFDIGAHYGFLSLLCATAVGESGRIHAFEPTPSSFAILRENAQGRGNIVLNELAVYRAAGELELLDYGTRLSAFNSAAGGRLDERLLAGARPTSFRAKMISLDDYVQRTAARPDVIKIDAEKAELAVLQGGQRTLAEHRPVVIAEVGDEPNVPAEQLSRHMVQHLLDRGYGVYRFQDGSLQPQSMRDRYEPDNLIFIQGDRRGC